jgi:WD40 repeat protein
MAKTSRISLLSASLLALASSLGGLKLNAAEHESALVAAYFHPSGGAGQSVLTLFPDAAAEAVDVSLPNGLTSDYLVSFGSDSKSIYLSGPPIVGTDGAIKIEFKPTRASTVPGSAGLRVGFLTISGSGRIFVSASDFRNYLCGVYEIDPDTGTHRPLRVGGGPSCGGTMGSISPDGRRVLSTSSRPRTPGSPPSVERLTLLDLEAGATRSLGEGRGTWSPDGRWIAVSGHGRIVLIDARDASHRKTLGPSGVNDILIWSPDSKQLLFAKQERRCSDDFESLEVLAVETGKRHAIQSAHCAVTSSAVGWINPEAVR